VRSHNDANPSPPEEASRFWDTWNRQWRFRDDQDAFMQRQREIAVTVARDRELRGARILDVGCGTGWLGHALLSFGSVWGTDLSPGAIVEGSRRHPDLTLICGDFQEVALPGPFDLVVSADALPHMPDYAAFFSRVAGLVRPGGTFLLMTQNPFVWRRRHAIRHVPSYLPHADPTGWPSLGTIRSLLQPAFAVEQVTTIDPGGDRGVLWWVENRYVRYAMQTLVGRMRWCSILERAGVGRELVVVARRN
jgi:2-polyprenyl-3-methyl-5-hydroxy-6-metoxy-1,4-benzoquinol methylase